MQKEVLSAWSVKRFKAFRLAVIGVMEKLTGAALLMKSI